MGSLIIIVNQPFINGPIVMYQDRHIAFCGTLSDKTRSVSFYGTARSYRGLREYRLRFHVFDVIYRQIKLMIMLLHFTAVLRASVGQYPQH